MLANLSQLLSEETSFLGSEVAIVITNIRISYLNLLSSLIGFSSKLSVVSLMMPYSPSSIGQTVVLAFVPGSIRC